MKLKPLKIGELVADIPIIQGGMGVGISLSSLAGAVAKEGAIGIISAAQPGYTDEESFGSNSLKANLKALNYHIKKAKEISNNGIIGVNVMVASKNYNEYIQCCVESGADIIISGAGLPIELPVLLKDTTVKFAPIISSLKAIKVLFKMWTHRYQCVSDFVVIEGPKAGGHLGFSPKELENNDFSHYDDEIVSIINYVKSFEQTYEKKIPVIFAGGVFDRKDIDHSLSLGCDGVQMATRFVATKECDADENYKMAYINAKKEDIVIVNSPVGMPARAINNDFTKLRSQEKEHVSKCYRCLKNCNPAQTPYCITSALVRAVKGDTENALVFCGENAYRLDKITTVKELLDELNQ